MLSDVSLHAQKPLDKPYHHGLRTDNIHCTWEIVNDGTWSTMRSSSVKYWIISHNMYSFQVSKVRKKIWKTKRFMENAN